MAQWSGNGSRPNSRPQEEPNIDLLPWVGAYNLRDALGNDKDEAEETSDKKEAKETVDASAVGIYGMDSFRNDVVGDSGHNLAGGQAGELTSDPLDNVQGDDLEQASGENFSSDGAEITPKTEMQSDLEEYFENETVNIQSNIARSDDGGEPGIVIKSDTSPPYVKDSKTEVQDELAKSRLAALESELQHLQLLSKESDIIIENISPALEDGRFLRKFQVGESVKVTADIFTYGSAIVRAKMRWRYIDLDYWEETPMHNDGNDLFTAEMTLEAPGRYEIEIQANVDEIAAWRQATRNKLAAGIFDANDVAIGEHLLRRDIAEWLEKEVERQIPLMKDERLPEAQHDLDEVKAVNRTLRRARDLITVASVIDALDKMEYIIEARPIAYSSSKVSATAKTAVYAQRRLCRFSTWYECFPRSTSDEPGRAGTLKDLIKRLDYIADMGFNVLYLPPIHPIGITNRKGKNNSLQASSTDVGSPWAIGSKDGGHEAIAKELGTLTDFHKLVSEANRRGIEIALDIAFQCSPDHPWVSEHPDWFNRRADGTIMCAENPPKRYEDVYPLNFDTEDKEGLWLALYNVIMTWRHRGVRVFRVDNPHTKPFDFWEWALKKVHEEDPGVVFLAEAFTRPKIMHYLAKIGFDQSYTYYTWRDNKDELVSYFEELAHGPHSGYFCPNVWPNTPDILAKSLQSGGRSSFIIRLIMAGGLSANYGIYGPVFELLDDTPVQSGSEEYRNSEKYEVRWHNLNQENSLAPIIKALNTARNTHLALQNMQSLHFHGCDNNNIICWSKTDASLRDRVIAIVNIDPSWTQSGFIDLDISKLGILPDEKYTVRDLLDDCEYEWKGSRNFVLLDPSVRSAHLFEVILNR